MSANNSGGTPEALRGAAAAWRQAAETARAAEDQSAAAEADLYATIAEAQSADLIADRVGTPKAWGDAATAWRSAAEAGRAASRAARAVGDWESGERVVALTATVEARRAAAVAHSIGTPEAFQDAAAAWRSAAEAGTIADMLGDVGDANMLAALAESKAAALVANREGKPEAFLQAVRAARAVAEKAHARGLGELAASADATAAWYEAENTDYLAWAVGSRAAWRDAAAAWQSAAAAAEAVGWAELASQATSAADFAAAYAVWVAKPG